MKQKSFFIVFKGFSGAKNCLRCESLPLTWKHRLGWMNWAKLNFSLLVAKPCKSVVNWRFVVSFNLYVIWTHLGWSSHDQVHYFLNSLTSLCKATKSIIWIFIMWIALRILRWNKKLFSNIVVFKAVRVLNLSRSPDFFKLPWKIPIFATYNWKMLEAQVK